MKTLHVRTHSREEIIDLTSEVQDVVASSGVKDGLCIVFVPHTTAGVTINENADPDVRTDFLAALRRAVPDNLPFAHSEGNSPAHIKASLIGSSLTVIVADGGLCLGTWQGIQFCEFDGPRSRKLYVRIL